MHYNVVTKMRTKDKLFKYAIEAASLALFLAIFSGLGWPQSTSLEDSGSMSFSVTLREWFILEVSTAEESLTSEGASGVNLVSTLNAEGRPVRIRAFASVSKNQAFELRVQTWGDLKNSLGETLAISDLAWEGTGEGFVSGRFQPSGSAVLARWAGSGFHEGTVRYFTPKNDRLKGDLSQRAVYSLAAL